MFSRFLLGLTVTALMTLTSRAEYAVKVTDAAPPDELAKPIRDVLGSKAIQFLDDKGEVAAEFWFRKEVPAKATPEQVKNGLTYRELEETTLLGAVRFVKGASDYRKQKIKPGVYTLRLGFQPEDGDHMGTAPYPDFCLLLSADKDKDPGPFAETKQLRELSAASVGTSHPGVLLLFPGGDAGAEPKVVSKPDNHWALSVRLNVVVDGKKTPFGIDLTLVGHSSAA